MDDLMRDYLAMMAPAAEEEDPDGR